LETALKLGQNNLLKIEGIVGPISLNLTQNARYPWQRRHYQIEFRSALGLVQAQQDLEQDLNIQQGLALSIHTIKRLFASSKVQKKRGYFF
jgi:hypothetical protein